MGKMTRELRPRNSRFDYAPLFQSESDPQVAGPSTVTPMNSEPDHEPEYSGIGAKRRQIDSSSAVDEYIDQEHDDAQLNAWQLALSLSGKKRTGRKSSSMPSRQKAIVTLTPGLSRPANRQNYALPNPSSEHRHRSHPLYRHTDKVERLTTEPTVCSPAHMTFTNNWTLDADMTNRVNKVSGYNVGAGPLWQYLEDRSWWKESVFHSGEEVKELCRRPRVYEWLPVKDGWQLLDIE